MRGATLRTEGVHRRFSTRPTSCQRNRTAVALRTLPISAKTGEGLDALKAALVSFARENFGATEAPLITRARHRQEIERARAAWHPSLRAPGPAITPSLPPSICAKPPMRWAG